MRHCATSHFARAFSRGLVFAPQRRMGILRAAIAVSFSVAMLACGASPDGEAQSPSDDAGTATQDDGGAATATDTGTTDAGHADGAAPASDAAHASDSAAAHDTAHDTSTSSCPVLAYPSGVHIQTYEDATMTASYAHHLASGQTAPKCFLDVTRLDDPIANKRYDMSVMVATNFALSELVGTEVSQGYGNIVLMDPEAVASLERFRVAVGTSVSVNSGFRSPRHQEATCNGLCGMPLGCPGTCANNSRHMWGDAFDLPLAFYTSHDEDLACAAGFKFAYLESGTHLHVDRNPAYATCVKQ